MPDPPSISSSGYSDGLGRRELAFDRETGTLLERLYVRPEIGVFDAAISARVDRLQSLDDERFARPVAVERDGGRVVVVSEYVAGVRVSDLLEAPDALQDAPTLDLALGFLLEGLPALAAFHATTGGPHGQISTGRTVLTFSPRVVFLDSAFGEVLGRLHYGRARLWREFGLAMPPSAGPSRFTVSSDIGQLALAALMLVLGRPIRENEFPHGLSALVSEVADVALIRGSDAFAAGLQQFLQTALPISGQHAYRSAQEALGEVRRIAELEMGTEACSGALTAFIEQIDVGAQPLPAPIAAIPSLHLVTDDEPAAEEATGETDAIDIDALLRDSRDTTQLEQEILLDGDEQPATFDLSLAAAAEDLPATGTSVDADTSAPPLEHVALDADADRSFSDSPSYTETSFSETTSFTETTSFSEPPPVEESTAFSQSASYSASTYDTPAFDEAPPPAPIELAPVFEDSAPVIEDAYARPLEEPAAVSAAPEESTAASAPAGEEQDQDEAEPEPARSSFFSPRRKKDDKSKSARARKDRLRSAAAAFKESVISKMTQQADREPPERDVRERRTPEGPAPVAERPPVPVRPPAAAAAPEPPPLPPPPPKPAPPPLIPAHRAAAFEPPIPDFPAPAPPKPFAAPSPAGPVVPSSPVIAVAPSAAPPPAPFTPPAPPSPPMPVFTQQPISLTSPAPPTPIQVQGAGSISVANSTPAIPLSPSTPALKLKTPMGLSAPPRRERIPPPEDLPRFPQAAQEDAPRQFPWKLAAAAIVIILAGVVAGRAYLPDRKAEQQKEAAAKAAIEAAAKLPPARRGPAPVPSGKVVIETQPAGAKVLMDGLAAGQTPLTLDSVPAGRHVVTLISESGSVKRTIKVEAGQTVTIDVPIFGGWVAIFAPITFEVSEKGRAIGNTEEGRLMLSPGRHELTLTNKALGYSAVHTVEIEPGEVRSLTLEPKGKASLNAAPWAEVWIEDKKVGETPLTYELPLGVHNVVFRNPQFGERRGTVTVRADQPATLSVDFNR